MIVIYSNTSTSRLRYTLDVLFKHILKVPYTLTNTTGLLRTDVPGINYSQEKVKADISITPHSLLFQETIEPQDIQVTHLDGIPYFFKTNPLSDFQFDIFAASFYMLSRYEEYLPFTPDKHRRFTAKESLAYKGNFLQKPVVHLWALKLKEAILQQHPSYLFPETGFSQINTIDVDVAYACKGKPLWRRIAGSFKKLSQIHKSTFWQQIFCNDAKDPYDTYAYLEQFQKRTKAKTVYFFQVGNYGKYDKNLPVNTVMKFLINRVSKYADVGLHPSYRSNTNKVLLQKEYKKLSTLLANPLLKSRQHYLKLSLPDTYENLISLGIKEDYTMGFAEQVGFRAGMALPFPFFNLKQNKERPLLIVPFQIMDGTLKDYQSLDSQKAINTIKEIKQAVKEVQGQLVSIFHNSSLTEQGEWQGWRAVYQYLFEEE